MWWSSWMIWSPLSFICSVLEICISINQIFGSLQNCKLLYFMIKPLNEMNWDDLKFIHSFHSYHLLLTNLNDFKFIPQRHLVTNTLWWKASNSVILELLNTLREVIHTFGVYMLGMYFLAFQKILWDTPLSKESGITTGRQSNMKLFHFAT